jgi:hypothetical protein
MAGKARPVVAGKGAARSGVEWPGRATQASRGGVRLHAVGLGAASKGTNSSDGRRFSGFDAHRCTLAERTIRG